jgi:hypothetical protein
VTEEKADPVNEIITVAKGAKGGREKHVGDVRRPLSTTIRKQDFISTEIFEKLKNNDQTIGERRSSVRSSITTYRDEPICFLCACGDMRKPKNVARRLKPK